MTARAAVTQPKNDDKWTMIYWSSRKSIAWGVKIEAGMRVKDLPEWFHPCFDHSPGSLYSVRFHSGKFWSVAWFRERPIYEYDPIETEIVPGDWLVVCKDSGPLHIRGQYYLAGAD